MRRIVALAVAASSMIAAGQQDIPRFKSGVDVVQFTVTVLDKERRPVTGLTAADFEVLVDGKPRPLAAFAAVTLPDDVPQAVTATVATSVALDVQTNRLPPEGRLAVIVMDRSTPDGAPMQAARRIANTAIDRLGPADLGAVVFTAVGLLKYSQGLTADRARLHAAVDEALLGAVPEMPSPPSLAAFAASRGAPQPSGPLNRVQLANEELSGFCRCGVCVIDALTELAKALSGARVRHKSILFVGSDIAIATRSLDCNPYVYPARDRLMRAIDEANVTFHELDPRALEALSETAELDRPAGRAEQGTNLYRQELLTVLPDHTGGRIVMNTNTPWDKIVPIFDESRTYYVLAIAREPGAPGAEDRHQVAVSVKRTDATVRTRNLTFAENPAPDRKPAPNAAAAALRDLLPRSDFPLQMKLVPQFSQDGSPEVRVLLGMEADIAGKLDVLIAAYDRQFTPVGESLKQRLDIPAAVVAGRAGFQWTSVLKPPPGDYEVRAAVATADGTRAASVIGYIDVPDVKKAGLALSGIVVKSAGAPTLRRAFAASEPIGVSFQVARAQTAPADVAVSYRLTDDANGDLASGVFPRPATGTGAVEPYDFVLHLPDAAGRYVLTIEASDGRRVARREIPLTVR
jgi:VWFA-related protein